MRKQWRKRLLSGILAALMVLGCVPAPALAADTDGLCPHHPRHTEECGYRAAVEGQFCGHEHTNACYAPVTQCVHAHGDCGYVAAVEGSGCVCQPDENGQIVHEEGCGFREAVEGIPCDHVCSEESGCITMALHCPHAHDDTCGFAAEQPEVPCGFACELCAMEAADRQAVEAVGALLEALPTVEELEAIPGERRAEAFDRIREAYEAYNALTEAQRTLLSGAEETFSSLFACMEALTEPAPTEPAPTESVPTEPVPAVPDPTESAPTEPDAAEPLQEENAQIVPAPTAPAASGTCGEDAQWFFDEETGCLTITGTGEIHGNSSVHGCVGTGVEHCSPWYFFREQITSAVIEAGITKIDYCTFEGCESLRSVEIPESVTSIGRSAFCNCEALESVILPPNLATIGNHAFAYCYHLEEVSIPEGVTEIDEMAFHQCERLRELIIPSTVTRIGRDAFSKCYSLTQMILPDGVREIGGSVFGECTNLQSVRLPAGLTEIPEFTFTSCTQLSDLTLPEGVGKIGKAAFQHCEALKELSVPDTVEAIGSYAFNGSGLRKIRFNGKAPAMGEAAFGGVSATAYYPREEAGWTEEVFQNYGGGITWVPYTDGHIHDFSASHRCECGLIGGVLNERISWRFESESETLTISGSGWTPWQDSIQDIDWWNCPELLNPRTDVRHVVVEKGITCLGAQTLSDLESLETVNLPEGLLELDYRCFGTGGNRMTQLTLPGTLETLGNWALWNLNLRELVVPEGVRNVDRNAFPRTIEKLTFLGDAPIQTERVYTGPDSWYTRIVPFLEGYSAVVYYPAENDTWDWNTRRSLGGSITWVGVGENETTVDGDCGDSLRWTLRDGILEFSGYGEMADYSRQTPAPWHPFADSIREVRLGGCFRIGAYAFAELTALESVTIPEFVNVIGKMAFGDCSGLSKITFSGSVPYSISDTAFTGVRAFAHYTIGKYNTSIEYRLKDYGGTLIWVEHGESPRMLTIEQNRQSLEVGAESFLTVIAHPYNATADCTFTLSREGILAIRQTSFRKLTFQAIAPGEVTVTARDKTTGLTASTTIRVMDSPRVIGCPFQENLVIDRIPFQRDYQFTPERTGYYALLFPYADWESDFSVMEGENYLSCSGFQNRDGIGCAVYFLTEGKSYRISCGCGNEALLGTAGAFRLREAEESVASISFAQDERCFTIEQNQEGVYEGWAEIQARLFPMEAYAPIQWTLNSSYYAEIEETYGSYCCLKLKHPGSVVLTASCGGQFASMRIVIKESGDILDLELDEPVEVAPYDGEHSGLLRFRAPQDGWYAFQREGDGDFGNWFSFVNEGSQGQSAGIRYLNRGETVTMRLIPRVEGETGTARVWVSNADPSPRAMEVVCVENRQGGVSFRANFQPLNAFCENISWSVSNPELLGRSRYDGSPYDNRISLTPYGHGEVTVTATTENGLTASCTVTVGACFAGHDWRTEVIEPGCETGGFTISRCGFCGEIAISDRLPAMGHTPVIDPAVEPTCQGDGKTEGQHCAVCETILVAQEPIPGGHRFEDGICVRCQEPEFPPEIRILPAVTELVSGQKQQLTAWRWPEERRVNVTWSLAPGDEAYGEISPKGLLTAKQVPGVRLVTVNAVTNSGEKGSRTFRILPKTTALFITVDGGIADGIQTVDLLERSTLPLSVQAEPVGAGNGVRWSSSATSVASVDAQGMVTLKKPGTALVTATALDGSKVSAKLTLRVIYADPAKKLTAVSDAPSGGLLPGERAQVSLAGEAPIPSENVIFSIPAREQEIATVDAHGVVTAGNRAGTVTVTAALKGDPLGRKATVKVPVFVRDYAPRLESGKLTLNGYASQGTPIDLRASYGNEIQELILLNRTEQFRLEDNTLHSIGLLKNGTYPLSLQARCRNGESYTYGLQVKVSNTLPTVMVKQSGKLNLFYLDSAVNLSITASGQRITDVQMTGTEDFALDYDGGTDTAILRSTRDDGGKPNTKAVLQVSVAGYTEPVTKSFTISTTTAVPKLGVSPASSTINTTLHPEDLSAEVTLRNASTGETLEPDSVTCTSDFVEVSGAGDTLTLTLKERTGGTAEIYVKEENWAKPLKLTHKITVTDKAPTLTLGTRTLKLSTRFPGVAAQTMVGLSQRNLELAGVELTCTDPEAEKLSVYCQDGKILAEFSGEALPKPGTYSYTYVGELADGMGTISGGIVKVTVTDAQPKVTLSPKGKLDTLDPDSGILYTPKLTNCLGALTDAELDEAFCTQFDTEVVSGRIRLTLRQGEKYSTAAPYKIRFKLTVGGEALLSPVLSVRVSQSAAKVTALPSNFSLFLSQSEPLAGQLRISQGSMGEVAISEKTSSELRAAMGEPQAVPCGAALSFRLPIEDTSLLTAGKSYGLYLDVTPENNAENVDPIRIKLTVKVMK